MGFSKFANTIWQAGIRTKKSEIVPWGNEVETQLAALAAGAFVLPSRLGGNAELITDWNDAVASGWFRGNSAANSPDAGWFIGVIVSHAADWVTQDVWAFSSDSEITEKRYRRGSNNGTWTAWHRVYTTGPEILAYVEANTGGGGGAAPVVQVFTASGTYTPTVGAIAAHVIVTGGGRGGGNSNNSASSGGAGGTSIKMIDLSGVTSAAITVGAGGAGASWPTAGANSIYDDGTTTLTGNGGTASNGGDATGGDINFKGGAGALGNASWDTGMTGGASYWGTGGGQGGADQGAYGGGGAMGKDNTSGGDGGAGVVYIVEYF